MPDHVHFLVGGFSSESDLRKFVNLAKQHSSYDYALNTGKALWQSGYYDRILRQSEDSRSVARYIVENPVRAGLVESPRDYPYLGSAVWTIDELLESCW
jgi:REP element-mobilizing transposase RayT